MKDTQKEFPTKSSWPLNGSMPGGEDKDKQKEFSTNGSWPFASTVQDTSVKIPPTLADDTDRHRWIRPNSSVSISKKAVTPPSVKQSAEMKMAALLQERCRQICLSIFFRNQTKIQSLGITSSIAGEGKSFIAMMIANSLARDVDKPITLLECNWENPTLHKHYGLQETPGLAEWLRGECRREDICHRIRPNLTVIPAGSAGRDAVRLLQRMQEDKLSDAFLHSDGILIVDLPPVATSAYGPLAASLVDSLIFVVHVGVTGEPVASEAYSRLEGLPIYGVVFNHVESRMPRWIRQLF